MNDVVSKQVRDLQTRFFDSDVLKLISALGAANVQSGAEESLANQLKVFGTKVTTTIAIELLELTKLFLECHSCKQRINARLDIWGLLRMSCRRCEK